MSKKSARWARTEISDSLEEKLEGGGSKRVRERVESELLLGRKADRSRREGPTNSAREEPEMAFASMG